MGDRGADMGTTLHQGQNRSLPNRPSHHRHQCKETPIARHDRMEITWNEDSRQNPTTGKQTKPSYILSTQNQSTKMDTWYHKTTIKQWKLTSKTGTPSGETQKSQDRVRWWIQFFDDKGKGHNPGPDYKTIWVHMVYTVKHCGKHCAQLVAGVHITDTPLTQCTQVLSSSRSLPKRTKWNYGQRT